MTEGDTVSVDFEFTNIGTAPIKIESIESCHCTQTVFDAKPIAPGAKSTITRHLRFARYDGQEREGFSDLVQR